MKASVAAYGLVPVPPMPAHNTRTRSRDHRPTTTEDYESEEGSAPSPARRRHWGVSSRLEAVMRVVLLHSVRVRTCGTPFGMSCARWPGWRW